MSQKLRVKVRDKWYTVEVDNLDASPIRALVDGEPVEVVIEHLPAATVDTSQTTHEPEPARERETVQTPEPQAKIARPPAPVKVFRAPMPGGIVSVSVKVGDQVVTGDEICVLEAMKMQQSLRADWSGIVKVIHVVPGQHVVDGDPIAELE